MPENTNAFSTLRRFVGAPRKPLENCDLCSFPLADGHQHLLELANRRIVCTCDPCAVLFSDPSAGHYRRVPRRILILPEFRLNDSQWESLTIPINLAYLFNSSSSGKIVALYPSPAGAVEAVPDLEAWNEIVQNNPVLTGMEPDVEGLLVNRVKDANSCFLAPVDECFRLVGLFRTHWRGLSGGTRAWQEIGRFFDDLEARATKGASGA